MIAIEPWFLAGTGEIRMDKDGWTIRSADGTRGVHVEHTVAITAGGPLVLTDGTGRSADWRNETITGSRCRTGLTSFAGTVTSTEPASPRLYCRYEDGSIGSG